MKAEDGLNPGPGLGWQHRFVGVRLETSRPGGARGAGFSASTVFHKRHDYLGGVPLVPARRDPPVPGEIGRRLSRGIVVRLMKHGTRSR